MSGARPARTTRPKSRWPELMVGVVTLALLAGFGTLVLNERNRPVVAQTPPPPTTPVIPSSPGTLPEPQPVQPVTPPATPQTTPEAAQTAAQKPASQAPTTPATKANSQANSQALDPANAAAPTPATAPGTTAPGITEPAQTPPGSAPAGAEPSAGRPTGVAQTSEIPPVPKAPPVQPITPPVLPESPTTAQSGAAPVPPSTQEPAPAAVPAVPVRPGGAVATSENRVPLKSDYRISLGSFTTRKTVESQTANVRGLGYTVHAIDLGNQYVAQIGPFANEEAARQALTDIQRTYPGALLYRPRNAPAAGADTAGPGPTTADSSAAAPATPSPSAPTTAAPQATPAPTQAAPSGPTYLQVGAFDREESAQRLVGILHDNGFNPTVNSPEGRKTTVMVGPYSGDALLRAEARLGNAGLDHFRVR